MPGSFAGAYKHVGLKNTLQLGCICYNKGMKKQLITLTALLFICATFAAAHVRISLPGGVRNMHRQGVVGLVKGNTGSVLSRYRRVPRATVRPTKRVKISVRGGVANRHTQGVKVLARGKNEATLSHYRGVNPTALERRITAEVTRTPNVVLENYVPRQTRVTGTVEEGLRQSGYEIKVPNENGGFDTYYRAPDGTITLQQPK